MILKRLTFFLFFFFCKRFSQFSSTNNISIPMEFDTREYLYLNISYPKFHLEFPHIFNFIFLHLNWPSETAATWHRFLALSFFLPLDSLFVEVPSEEFSYCFYCKHSRGASVRDERYINAV